MRSPSAVTPSEADALSYDVRPKQFADQELCQRPMRSRRTRRLLSVVGLGLLGLIVRGATTPADLPAQTTRPTGFVPRVWALKQARIVVSPEREIERGTLVIRDGLIAAVGDEHEVTLPVDAEVIDAAGLVVYAGFIDAATTTGLDSSKPPTPVPGRNLDVSRSSVAGTPVDQHKSLTPEFEAGSTLKFEGATLENRRKAGFTTMHILPQGRVASGKGVLLATSGAPLREAVLRSATWSEFQLFAPGGQGYPNTMMGAITHLRQTFLDARHDLQQRELYARKAPGVARPAEDAVLQSLGGLVAQKQPLLFLAQSHDDIHRALDFADEQQLPAVIWGGREAWRVRERLQQTKTPVLLDLNWGEEPKIEAPKTLPAHGTNPATGSTASPSAEKPADQGDKPRPDAADAKKPTKIAPLVQDPLGVQQDRQQRWRHRVSGIRDLQQAGILWGVSTEGLKEPDEAHRALRQAIAAGLARSAALAGLTTHPAQLLGLGERLGTLEVGKLAHVVVMTGTFDDERSKTRYVFLEGQKFEYHPMALPVTSKPAATPPQAEVAGLWQLTIDTAEGLAAGTLELTQNDTNLGGHMRSPQGEGRVTSGKVQGDKVEFVVTIGAGAQGLELKFSGTAEPAAAPATTPGAATDSPPRTAGLTTTVDTRKLVAAKLSGTLKSPFGAATKWSAQRQPAQPGATSSRPSNPVTIGIDDQDQKPEPKTATTSASPQKAADPASSPSSPATPAATKPAAAPTIVRLGAVVEAAASAAAPLTTWNEFPIELDHHRRQRHVATGGNLLLRHATLFTGKGEPLQDAAILIRQGKIVYVGADQQAPIVDASVTVIDVGGRFVMAGIIDTHSHIMFADGLPGVNEATMSIVPEVRVKDVVKSDDIPAYRALAGGVTTIRMLHGSANVIGGQDAVVKLKFGSPAKQQILHDAPSGVKFALGENVKFQTGRFPNTRLGVEATLQRAFIEALEYRRGWHEYRRELALHTTSAGKDDPAPLPPRRDLRLESLLDILERNKFIHSHCYRSDEILMLLRVVESHGIRVRSLQHVLEGYKVAPEIVAHGASCSTFADWWAYKVEAFDATPYNAALLQQAGANVVIKSDDAELIRHLWQEAAKTVRYGGMPVEAALKAITLNPARELMLDSRLGSLEVGKEGDLAVYSGHPLNAFSRVELTVINGEIHFWREKQPSAMSPAAALASNQPANLEFPSPDIRQKQLDLPADGTKTIALVGGTIHPIEGPEIASGTLLMHNGKITAVAASVDLPEGTHVIDVKGLHVYPGLIDAGTTTGITEIGKVRETHDTDETGTFQPDLRAGVAINPDSELIPAARAGGITTALVKPTGGIICGQSSLVQWAGWTAPEMVLNPAVGLQINWTSGAPAAIEQLRDFLKQGRLYHKLRDQSKQNPALAPVADPRYEALGPYLRGEKPVLIEAHSRADIAQVLDFCEQEQLKLILCGGTDAWKLAGELKRRNIPVIVGPTLRAPLTDYDTFDAPYANPGRLHEAGVLFAIRSNNPTNSRNAPFEAAMSVAYGLPADIGLKSVTLHAARILGVEDKLGSLKAGKLAHVIVTDGSPLQPTTQYKAIFIQGKPFRPESRQTRFYEKYKQRLAK